MARFFKFPSISGGRGDAHKFIRTQKWSLHEREGVKHSNYRVRTGDGTRRTTNGRVVPILANSYGACGREALQFFQLANSVARRLGRSCASDRLEPIVQSMVIYFVASGVLEAYYPRPE